MGLYNLPENSGTMPTAQERRRGGVVRYRTIKLARGKYAHVAVVRKRGKRGGYTILGKIHKTKRRMM